MTNRGPKATVPAVTKRNISTKSKTTRTAPITVVAEKSGVAAVARRMVIGALPVGRAVAPPAALEVKAGKTTEQFKRLMKTVIPKSLGLGPRP